MDTLVLIVFLSSLYSIGIKLSSGPFHCRSIFRSPFQPIRNLGSLYNFKKCTKKPLRGKSNVATIFVSSLVLILWRISVRKLGSPAQFPPTDHLTHKALRGVQELSVCQLLAETCHKNKHERVLWVRNPSYICCYDIWLLLQVLYSLYQYIYRIYIYMLHVNK